MNEPRDRRQPQALELPDLELSPPRRTQSGTHAVPKERPAYVSSDSGSARVSATLLVTAGSASGSGSALVGHISSAPPEIGSTFELDEDALFGPVLELEREAEISRTGISATYGRDAGFGFDDFAPAVSAAERHRSTPAIELAHPALELRSRWPTGVTAAREHLMLNTNEVRALAGYGEPPTLGPLAPFYALRVFRRRRALMNALRAIDDQIARAEAKRDAQLGELAERLRPELAADPTFSRLYSDQSSPADIARKILTKRDAIDLDPALLDPLRQADERLEALVRRSEMHLRALDVCDEDTIQQGYVWFVAFLVLVSGLAVWQLA
jgi:hypothetical protein